jgi:hypothetical protein
LIAVRASMSFNLSMFLENKEISQLVKEKGLGVLPITTNNGRIIARKKYLTYAELKKHIEQSAPFLSPEDLTEHRIIFCPFSMRFDFRNHRRFKHW